MIEVDIKWVNDIYFKNKKIAGILTEAMTSVETGLVTDVIIGLGINFSIADFQMSYSISIKKDQSCLEKKLPSS